MNLLEALQEEINRNNELLQMYKEIKTGMFGAMMIKQKIEKAEKAIASGDTVLMIACYKELQDSQ